MKLFVTHFHHGENILGMQLHGFCEFMADSYEKSKSFKFLEGLANQQSTLPAEIIMNSWKYR